jgi:hypothetical protein
VLDELPDAMMHMHSRCPTPSWVAAHQRTPMRSWADEGCWQIGQTPRVGSWSMRELMERLVMLWSLCPRLAGHCRQATPAGCRDIYRGEPHCTSLPRPSFRGHRNGSTPGEQDRRNSTRSVILMSVSNSSPSRRCRSAVTHRSGAVDSPAVDSGSDTRLPAEAGLCLPERTVEETPR